MGNVYLLLTIKVEWFQSCYRYGSSIPTPSLHWELFPNLSSRQKPTPREQARRPTIKAQYHFRRLKFCTKFSTQIPTSNESENHLPNKFEPNFRDPRATGEDSSVGILDVPIGCCLQLTKILLTSSLAIPPPLRALGQFYVCSVTQNI